MFDTDTNVEEWLIEPYRELEKGGPGSGEGPGHPFRGNGHTSASFEATAHNVHGDEAAPGSTHLAMAITHASAAQHSLDAGDKGGAMRHFNEAARHAAWAVRHHDTGQVVHQQAKALYAAAHHAGDLAEIASKTHNDAAMIDRNQDPDGAAMGAMKAVLADRAANEAAANVGGITTAIRGAQAGQYALQQGRGAA